MYYKLDDNGFLVDTVVGDFGEELGKRYTDKVLQSGLYKPKYDGENWIEGADDAYISSMKDFKNTKATELEQQVTDLQLALADIFNML